MCRARIDCVYYGVRLWKSWFCDILYVMSKKKARVDIKNMAEGVRENAILKEFKEFINRGSVMDLAVGMVIGAAFTAIVTSLVNDIIMPVVGLVAGGVDFTGLKWTIPNFFGADTSAVIAYGNFIQQVVNFLIVAFAIFMFVKFMNKLQRKKAEDEKAEKKKETEQVVLLREIRDVLKSEKNVSRNEKNVLKNERNASKNEKATLRSERKSHERRSKKAKARKK